MSKNILEETDYKIPDKTTVKKKFYRKLRNNNRKINKD